MWNRTALQSACSRNIAGAAAVFALFSACPASADAVRIGGTGSALGVMRLLGDAYAKLDPQFSLLVLPNLGSSGGLRAVAAGAVDVAVAARELTEEERRNGLSSILYGRTPLVLATARQGGTGVTRRQIADIYAGRQATWPDGMPIRLILRPPLDIDTRLVAAMSPAIAEAMAQALDRPGMLVLITDQESADNIERVPGALGASTLSLILAEKRRLNALPIDGVAPSTRSVADGTYPYIKPMFLVTRGVPAGSLSGFIGFIRSPQGKAVLEQTGHWTGPGPVAKPEK